MKKVLLISPHADDIAFSASGWLAMKKQVNNVIFYLTTIFTRSNHAPYLNLDDIEEISRVRQMEDLEFAMFYRLKNIHMGLSEALLRGYPSVDSLYHVGEVADDNIFSVVRGKLGLLFAMNKWTVVVAPLGIGSHVEHRMTAEICKDLCRSPVVFYEDLPYAADYSNTELDNYALSFKSGMSCLVKKMYRSLGKKIEALSLYRSQVGSKELRKVILYAKNRDPRRHCLHPFSDTPLNNEPVEVLWGNSTSLNAFWECVED